MRQRTCDYCGMVLDENSGARLVFESSASRLIGRRLDFDFCPKCAPVMEKYIREAFTKNQLGSHKG